MRVKAILNISALILVFHVLDATYGTRCIQCDSKNDVAKQTCSGSNVNALLSKATDCVLYGATATCVSVQTRNYQDISFSRGCSKYQKLTKDNKCMKSVVGTEVVTTCYCNEDSCNSDGDLDILYPKNLYCVQCEHTQTSTNSKCLDGTESVTKCERRSGEFASTTCATLITENLPNYDNIVKLSRECVYKRKHDEDYSSTSINSTEKTRTKAFYCVTDSCNYRSVFFYERFSECLVCSNTGNSKCQTSIPGIGLVYNADICPTSVSSGGEPSPISCENRVATVDDGTNNIYDYTCSRDYQPTPSCKKEFIDQSVQVRCVCNGKSCNVNYPPKDLIKKSGKFCLQCDHDEKSNSNPKCLGGEGSPTMCLDSQTFDEDMTKCTVETIKKGNQILSVSRGCAREDKDNCEVSDEGNGVTKTTCYCQKDWCNINNINLELSCYKCKYTEKDLNDCWKENYAGTTVICDTGVGKMSCGTSIITEEKNGSNGKTTIKVLEVTRGCTPFNKKDECMVDSKKDKTTKTTLITKSCFCNKDNCNTKGFGKTCIQCSSDKDDPSKTCLNNPGALKAVECVDGPQPNCELTFSRSYKTGEILEYSRHCIKYDSSVVNEKNDRCQKSYSDAKGKEGTTDFTCPCTGDGCNSAPKSKFSDLMAPLGIHCLDCKFDITEDQLKCYSGEEVPKPCPVASQSCLTTLLTDPDHPDLLLAVVRSCDQDNKFKSDDPDHCETILNSKGLREKTCACFEDSCNFRTYDEIAVFHEKIPECAICKAPGDEEDCKDPGTKVWVPKVCSASYNNYKEFGTLAQLSCQIKMYKDEKGVVKNMGRDCSSEYFDSAPFCTKKFDPTKRKVYTICHCNGRGCNALNFDDNLISQAGMMCLICTTTSADIIANKECQEGKGDPILCLVDDGITKDRIKSCIIEMTHTADGEIISVSRGCARQDIVKDYCEEGKADNNGIATKICYCEDDACNTEKAIISGTHGSRKPLKCWKCEDFHFTSEQNKESNCRKGRSDLVECKNEIVDPDYDYSYHDHYEGYSCFYSTFTSPGHEHNEKEVTGIKRGCSLKGPNDKGQLFRDCEALSNTNVDFAHTSERKCYCFDEGCNRNSPEGLKCLKCDYNTNKGCIEGDVRPEECRQKGRYDGAIKPSCVTTKFEDTETGKLLGISRDCVNYEPDGCHDPTKNGIFKVSYCYCNSDGCNNAKYQTVKSRSSGSFTIPLSVITFCALLMFT